MSESPQSIIDLFPHPTIEKSTEEPNYYSIKPVEKKLIRNVASIPTELGGGNHGFLGLVVTPQKHVNITGNVFTPHLNPGTFPTFPQNPTQPIIAQISATHKEALRVWRKQQTVIKCIKNQLTNAFEDKYFDEINDLHVGFNNVTMQDMLAYLYDRFGKISSLELEEGEKTFSEPFDATAPFGSFVKKIEETMDLAEAGGCPYTQEQLVSKSFNCILKAQTLPNTAIREWKRAAQTDKTWTNFKNHFAREVKEYQQDQGITASNSSYNVANAANQSLLQAQNDFKEITNSMIDDIRKEFYGALNSNNTNDQQCHLTYQQAQQAHLSQSNNDILTMIRELKEEIKDLKANRTRNYSQNTTPTYRSSPPNNILKFKYCWTHGCNRTHSSQHCRMPANNHKKDATIENMQGGCQFNIGHFLQAKEKSST